MTNSNAETGFNAEINNYAAIIQNNIRQLFEMDLDERATALTAQHQDGTLIFKAFGHQCTLGPQGITLDNCEESGPRGIVISLYGLQAQDDALVGQPFKSFKELPGSMPYVGAFTNRTEQALTPYVDRLISAKQQVIDCFDGGDAPDDMSGDCVLVVRPLPKIALCYACYAADEDFPAAVTCLYSRNADHFLSTDALADLGEYTTKAIQALL
jgi:hypothetical protein